MHDPVTGAVHRPGAGAPRAARPRWREPHFVRVSAVATGSSLTALWVLLWVLAFAGPASGDGLTATGFAWAAAGASTIAGAVAAVLARFGDRGVAVGIAAVAGTAAGVAGLVVWLYLLLTGDWILW